MNKYLKNLIIAFTLTASVTTMSFADVEKWINISDTQTIDSTYTTEQILKDKVELKKIYEEIQEIDEQLSNNDISKEKYLVLTKEKEEEYNTLFNKLEKFGLIKKSYKSNPDKPELIKVEVGTDNEIFNLLTNLNYLKFQMQSLDDKLQDNEITKDEYERLYKKYYAEYEKESSNLKIVTLKGGETLTKIDGSEEIEAVEGKIIDIKLDSSNMGFDDEYFKNHKDDFNKLEEKYNNQEISDEEYSKALKELIKKINKSSDSPSDSLDIIEVKNSGLIPASKEMLYTKDNIKNAIKILEDLYNNGVITKEQYEKKLKFYNEMSKKYEKKN